MDGSTAAAAGRGAAFGLAVEVQRRSWDAAGALTGRFGRPLRVLTRPAAALARGSLAVARHHLDLDGRAARGLAEQRRAQAAGWTWTPSWPGSTFPGSPSRSSTRSTWARSFSILAARRPPRRSTP